MTAYRVYDVFTDTPFGGNQLAVIPDATALPEGDLQKIAREFNFSETTFVFPPSDPAHTARVRIFTPTMEVPFAGHPTIGTAVALSDIGYPSAMVFELGIGPIHCSVSGSTAQFTTSAALDIIGMPDAATVAACVGLAEGVIKTNVHAPTQASLGLPFCFVELTDRAALSSCRPITDAFQTAAATYPSPLDFAVFAYVRDGATLRARMFAPLDDIPEDPATGSACATVTALLSQIADEPLGFTVYQGEDMGRPSVITTQAQIGNPMPIQVKGQAVMTMQGQLVYAG